jgi:hypothetical protein
LQARNAIIQADLVDTGGANRNELWAAFAKRGMGVSATSPASSTTTNLHEAFDVPDSLRFTPATGFVSSGGVGGPFSVTSQIFSLTNTGTASLDWTLGNIASWLNASPTGGTLATGTTTTVTFSLNAAASNLVAGTYSATPVFTNTTSGVRQTLTFNLTVLGAPVITTPPASATVVAGGSTNFSASVIGLPVLAYQWRLNGTNILNATNLTLALTGITTNQAGNYTFFVSNNLGAATSSVAVLTVLIPPPNDFCSGATVISVTNYTSTQTTVTATSTGDPLPNCVSTFFGKGVWYAFTPVVSGTMQVDTVGSSFDTVLGIYSGTCGALTQVGCNDDSGGTLLSRTTNAVTGGTTYFILAGGWNGDAGSLTLHMIYTTTNALPPTNDVCSTAIVIAANGYTNSQSTAGATSTGDPVPDCIGAFGKGVWYVFTPGNDGTLVADTIGSSFDTGLGIYTGSCGALTQAGCDDDSGGSATSKITLPVSGGTTCYILAGGYGGVSGTLQLHLNFSTGGSPPVIVLDPAGQVVPVGGTATFSVSATGAAPVNYFWQRDGVVIPDATATSYSVTNAQLADSGVAFSCLVTNASGSALSANAYLTVDPSLVIALTGATLDGSGQIQFQINGQPGDVYRVQSSTDLLGGWQTLASVTNISGTVTFTDTVGTDPGGRFYRCVMP